MKYKGLITLLLATAGSWGTTMAQDFGGYPFEVVAPHLLAAGMYDQVNAVLKTRTQYDKTVDMWSAMWIEVPGAPANDYGVYYFRKDLELANVPASCPVHVTGDERYKLYVNGVLASMGPARNDRSHWNYESLDLAQFLKPGKNVVAAVVWNGGKQKPLSEESIHTGFMLLGEGDAQELTTNNTWKCIQDPSYSPKAVHVPGFYAADPSELVDMNQHISNWMDADADLSNWQNAKPYELGTPAGTNSGTGGYDGIHLLTASTLPQLERTDIRMKSVRQDGGLKMPADFLAKPVQLTIPANKTVDILLDQEELTNAFFHLNFSQGQNANIQVTFNENLYLDQEGTKKGNRNEVEGKFLKGRTDEIISNGQVSQQFNTLAWRTYRYVNLHITTQDQPLVLNDVYGTFVGFPFQLKAKLNTDNQELQKMMEIGWRTARLCAIETYMDCPFYEQLQYLGDTRIQALISLYNSGDDRLVKNYLRQSDMSRNAEGVAMGRAPSSASPQYITPYALSYIYAIHDYMMYGKDQALVEDLLPGAEQILHYFKHYQQADGRLKNLPGWNFSDWVYTPGWSMGVAESGADGSSSLMDLQLLYAYQVMTEMEQHIGNTYYGDKYAKAAEQLKASIQEKYWDATKGLYADRAEKDHFSQHANSLALICGMTDAATAREIGKKLTEDKTLAPCSVYYKYYLHEALNKAGLGDDFLSWLDIWRENIKQGMTTWAETSDLEGTRSDCHAWGASPNIEFFRTLLGIDSSAPAFAQVKIEPHLGTISKIGGSMPHPQGTIQVSYEKKGNALKAEIELPQQVTGTFVYQGKTYELKGGKNTIQAK